MQCLSFWCLPLLALSDCPGEFHSRKTLSTTVEYAVGAERPWCLLKDFWKTRFVRYYYYNDVVL